MTHKLHISPPSVGYFTQGVLMPLGTPASLAGDRLWWRAHRVTPTGIYGYVSGWGESGSVSGNVATLSAGDAPSIEIHKAIAPIVQRIAGTKVTIKNSQTVASAWITEQRKTGLVMSSNVIIGTQLVGTHRVDFELFIPTLAPFALFMASSAAIALTPDGYNDSATIEVPEFGRGGDLPTKLFCGVPGQRGRVAVVLRPNGWVPATPEERLAQMNANAILRHGLPEAWTGDFCGLPVTKTWSALGATRLSHNIEPRLSPDDPGADPSYGYSVASLLWGTDRPAVDSLTGICRAADAYLDRQDSWVRAGSGEALDAAPIRAALYHADGYPLIPTRNDPYDDLGFGVPRGGRWPTTQSGRKPADKEHETGAALAAAAVLTNDLGYRLAARDKCRMLTYHYNFKSASEGQLDYTPSGRGSGRPLALLSILGTVDEDSKAVAADATRRWCKLILDAMNRRGVPRSMPVHYVGLNDGQIAGYEEATVAMGALICFRQTGSRTALEVAYRSGRTCATTMHFVDGKWQAAYWFVPNTDGSPRTLEQGGVTFAGPDMQSWSAQGLNVFLAACWRMAFLRVPLERDDMLWIQVAIQAREALLAHMPEKAVEVNAAFNQHLGRVDLIALSTPTVEVLP